MEILIDIKYIKIKESLYIKLYLLIMYFCLLIDACINFILIWEKQKIQFVFLKLIRDFKFAKISIWFEFERILNRKGLLSKVFQSSRGPSGKKVLGVIQDRLSPNISKRCFENQKILWKNTQ